jgi:hypothetical protein
VELASSPDSITSPAARRELNERVLTLYSTGRFDSRDNARTEAKAQLLREAQKRQQANDKASKHDDVQVLN